MLVLGCGLRAAGWVWGFRGRGTEDVYGAVFGVLAQGKRAEAFGLGRGLACGWCLEPVQQVVPLLCSGCWAHVVITPFPHRYSFGFK
jgi:hypothetical protein